MSRSTVQDLGTAAADLGRRGLAVFPVAVRGKAPLLAGSGYLDATVDVEQITRWWTEHPRANIGAVPGTAGLLVIDVDGAEGEREAVRLGLLAEPTLTVSTARGLHLYYVHPGGHVGNRKLAPGLDVRADAGYVLMPPSVHPSGAVYRWLRRCDPLPLPSAILALLRPAPTPRPIPAGEPPVDAGTPGRRAYVRAAIEDECLELANTGEGNRNNRLNEAAYSLARFVATGEADAGKLVDALHLAASHTGLRDYEIRRTIRSAFTARDVRA